MRQFCFFYLSANNNSLSGELLPYHFGVFVLGLLSLGSLVFGSLPLSLLFPPALFPESVTVFLGVGVMWG